jgi:hypothetical protein
VESDPLPTQVTILTDVSLLAIGLSDDHPTDQEVHSFPTTSVSAMKPVLRDPVDGFTAFLIDSVAFPFDFGNVG